MLSHSYLLYDFVVQSRCNVSLMWVQILALLLTSQDLG